MTYTPQNGWICSGIFRFFTHFVSTGWECSGIRFKESFVSFKKTLFYPFLSVFGWISAGMALNIARFLLDYGTIRSGFFGWVCSGLSIPTSIRTLLIVAI